MNYAHNPMLNVPGPIQNLQPSPGCPLAVTPEPVVARLLEVFRGMHLPKAQEAVQKTAGNHPSLDRWVPIQRDCVQLDLLAWVSVRYLIEHVILQLVSCRQCLAGTAGKIGSGAGNVLLSQ